MAFGPKRRSDWRTMLWCAAMPVVMAAQYARPALIPWLLPLAFYLAVTAGVMAHNHNHCPTFRSRGANRVFGLFLSIFYGYPTFAWIPTHNLNHHKFVNGPGDATITWRYGNRHDLFTAVTYFFVSSYWQSGPIKEYIAKAKRENRPLYWRIVMEYVVWLGTAAALLATAIALHGGWRGLGIWAVASVAPGLFALWFIMTMNFEQHVHADPTSEHNHSRSWSGPVSNFLLFNNGYHAAHPENAGLHWSELPRAHAALAPSIDPRLIEGELPPYLVRCYLLAPFFPRFRTTQLGPEPARQATATAPL